MCVVAMSQSTLLSPFLPLRNHHITSRQREIGVLRTAPAHVTLLRDDFEGEWMGNTYFHWNSDLRVGGGGGGGGGDGSHRKALAVELDCCRHPRRPRVDKL